MAASEQPPPLNHTATPPLVPPDGGGLPQMSRPPSPKSYRDAAVDETMEDQPRIPIDLRANGMGKIDFDEGNPFFPNITIALALVQEWSKAWSCALIVKILGRNVGFIALRTRALEIWKPKGKMDMMDLGHGFHLVKFQNPMDREHVVRDGPWMVQGHYLTVRTWSPTFVPSEATVVSTLVWARFPKLPLQYYDEDCLMLIGNSFGKAIRVDRNTAGKARGKFARVGVEIDLSKPLTAQFRLNGSVYHIEYEWLYVACTNCGRYGHTREECPNLSILKSTDAIPQTSTSPSTVSTSSESVGAGLEAGMGKDDHDTTAESVMNQVSHKESTYGEWMIVPKRKYTPRVPRQVVASEKTPSPTTDSSKQNPQGQVQYKKNGSREAKNKGVVLGNGSINKEFTFGASKSSGVAAPKPTFSGPPGFRDLSSHNIFGDLCDEVADASMDVDKAYRGKENGRNPDGSPGSNKRSRAGFGERKWQTSTMKLTSPRSTKGR
ncbi:uncharacterized protein [Euphorbia lathyris]|uniref:uncharacterized protein n=1 Tax=Euphorbia lathyris TaxID=212925 RepID=UPI0033131E94